MTRRLALLLATAFVLAGCTAEGIDSVTLVTHGSHTVASGDRLPGTVALAGGSLAIEAGATVGGDLFVGDGILDVAGSVGGDISALGGIIRLASGAHVAGTVQIGGSAVVERGPGVTIGGGIVEGYLMPDGPGRPAGQAVDIGWMLARSLAAVVVAELLRRLAPGRVGTARRYLVGQPAASISYGFLVAIVGISLIVFMAFTIVLIPVALVGLAGLGLAVMIGLAAALDAIRGRFDRARGGGFRAGLLLAVAVAIVPSVPVAGGPLAIAGVLTLIGAATLALQRPVPITAQAGSRGSTHGVS